MANNQKKYVSLSRLSDFLDNLKTKFAASIHTHTLNDITDYTVDSALSSTSTNPVQNKVLDAEFEAVATSMNALETAIDGKASSSHNHNDVYYTETEIDSKLAGKSDTTHKHDNLYDTKGAAADVQDNLDVVSDTLNSHTSNIDIHVTTTNKSNWNTAYTHSQAAHARTDATKVADSTTNGNILINGTETNVYSHPNSGVSAGTYKSVTVNAQGHITGGSNPTTLAGYGITDAETKSDASAKLTEAKTYADNAANTVKNDLLNNAGAAYDTLKELGDLIGDNKDAIDALEEVAAGKANATHTHAISDVTNLQSTLDGKAEKSHGTHVSYSTTAPVMDGTAAVGTASTVARSDHKHPTDTSRASKTEFDSHSADTTKHITATERTNWNAAKTHADSAHAPSNAQANQNAFSNIAVSGQTTVAADTTTDTVTFAGSNVSITTDATNDKVTFAVANGTTSAKGVVQLTDSVSSTSTTTAATPKNVKAAYDLANTAKTTATTAQTKADSAYTLAESKVDSLSDLGITATATELNYIDGVTSNVQVQLDSKVDENHTHSWDDLDDKPFYETDPVDTVIIPTLTFNSWYYETTTDLSPFVVGQKGSVVFDGVTYNNVVCGDNGNGVVILGSVDGSYDDYPFAVYINNGYLFVRAEYASGTVSHTIQVTIGVTQVVKLDEKFLPKFAGEVVADKTFDGYEDKGGRYAEIFNDYGNNVATGDYAHAEGKAAKALGDNSHAEGKQTTASGANSHAEGEYSVANGSASHAEGYNCTTESAYGNHAEGFYTTAKGDGSHSEGYYTIAGSSNQHVQGKYNIEDTSGEYAHIVGNGEHNARSNAHTLDWDGNAWFAGNVKVGGTEQDSTDAKILATQEYVQTLLNRTTSCGADTTDYTTYMARGEALFSSETTPTINGAIAWTYE